MKLKVTYRRHRGLFSVMIVALFLTFTAVLGSGSPASAADPVVVDFPPGIACAFPLEIEIVGGNQVQKEFVDKNGNVVRTLSAGKGSALTFTNLDTGTTLSLRPNGSVSHVTNNPDGSQTWTTTGHDVLILFPTDVPAGPSTTLYVGRLVFTVAPDGVFTLRKFSGKATDICAALSD